MRRVLTVLALVVSTVCLIAGTRVVPSGLGSAVIAPSGPDIRSISTATCNSGFYVDLDSNDARDAGEPCVARDGIYHAEDYASGSSTGGIEEAINAACTAVDGVVEFRGDITTTATINVDCARMTLRGVGLVNKITFANASTGIIVSEDLVTLENFQIVAGGTSGTNIGIQIKKGTGSISNIYIKNVEFLGSSCLAGCVGIDEWSLQKSSFHQIKVSEWDIGINCQKNTTGACNANEITGSVIRANTVYGFRVEDTTSYTQVSGSTFESNGIGAECANGAGGGGSYNSISNHYENTGAADIRRPATNGCAVLSIGDNFGTGATDFEKLQGGSLDDIFIASYFENGVTNVTANCITVIAPMNTFGATLDPSDVCLLQIDTGSWVIAIPEAVRIESTLTPFEFEGVTVDGTNITTLTIVEPTAARTITVPDSDQTIGTATTVAAPQPIVSLASGALTINTVHLATAGGADYDMPDDCDSATGNWVTVIVEDDSSTISITPFSGDTLVVPQLSLDVDDEMDSSGVAAGNGEHITLVCMATNTWFATSRSGAWADGGVPD